LNTAGIVGGTFDPVHVGHIGLARSAAAALRLDQIIFLPAGNPWQKQERLITPAVHRVNMLKLACASIPASTVDTLEIELADKTGQPNYTVETLPLLQARYPEVQRWVLILGSDQLRRLNTWHQWQRLTDYCHIAVTTREGISMANLPSDIDNFIETHGAQSLPRGRAGNILFFSMPPVAVSSTGLRQALTKAQSKDAADESALVPLDGLLNPAVIDYIHQHSLYQFNHPNGQTA
jgi:nicotinate-nucleotide adenylyltransferase